jgi:hypothetical protein
MSVKKQIGVFLLVLIAVMIGTAFLISIANSTFEQTNTYTVANESQSIASARDAANGVISTVVYEVANSYRVTGQTPISSFVLRASDGSTVTAGNYTLNNNGTYTLVNTTFWVGTAANTTYRGYVFKPANYVNDGTSRTIIPLIILFCALGILAVVLSQVFSGESMSGLLRLGGGAKVESAR